MKIQLRILNKEFYENYPLPKYAKSGDAGMDLRVTEDVTLYPGETKLLKTGLAIWIGSYNSHLKNIGREDWVQSNYMGMVVPRSGLGTRGLVLANTIGIIDSSYQGELMISALNRLNKSQGAYKRQDGSIWNEYNRIELKAGDRIAQLLFIPVIKASWVVVDEFSNKTQRGENGFGSTG
jgi:dUTP pyrophosphatase